MFPLLTARAYEAELPLKGRDPSVLGQCSPNHLWERHGHSLFLHTPVRVRGTSTIPRVLHRRLQLHGQAKGARVWAEVEDKAYMLGHQGFRGVSPPSHHQLTQRINQSYRVHFCYLAYSQGYYLILVHRIHSSLHQL